MKLCVYCGDPATTRDHVVPRSWRYTTYTVPACVDCNCRILRDVPLFTVEDRRAYVATHKKVRSAPQNTSTGRTRGHGRRASAERPRPTATDGAREGDPSSAAGLAFPPPIRIRRVVHGLPSVLNYKSKGWYVKGRFYPRGC